MGQIIWMVISICMTVMAAILAVYLSYYKKNIRHLNKEIQMILAEDTNYLLTTESGAKEIKEMVLLLNQSFTSVKELKKKMIRTNRAFKESITGVSHDLRTPLTSAGGFVQMLMKEELPKEERKEYIEIVWERIQAVRDLLDQLFTFARIEADEMEIIAEPVNLTNILYDTLSLYYQDFTERKEEPKVTVPEEPCIVSGNTESLKRVVTNIIYNALIHGDGDYTFDIKKGNHKILLCCSNHTQSIRQEDVENLFDRFYTSDKSRSRRTTGLGLSVAKRLTELMGGNIRADFHQKRLTIRLEFSQISEQR